MSDRCDSGCDVRETVRRYLCRAVGVAIAVAAVIALLPTPALAWSVTRSDNAIRFYLNRDSTDGTGTAHVYVGYNSQVPTAKLADGSWDTTGTHVAQWLTDVKFAERDRMVSVTASYWLVLVIMPNDERFLFENNNAQRVAIYEATGQTTWPSLPVTFTPAPSSTTVTGAVSINGTPHVSIVGTVTTSATGSVGASGSVLTSVSVDSIGGISSDALTTIAMIAILGIGLLVAGSVMSL